MPVTAERLEVQVGSSGTDAAAEGLSGIGTAAVDAKAAVGAFGAAIATASGILAGKAVSAASSYQDALVELEKVTNPETVDAMRGEILELSETIPLAATELADIASQAGRFGVRGPENIRQFTESVAKMANATDVSATEAGEAFAKLSQLTGTPISDVDKLGSAINELSNNAATSSSEIVDSMMRASSTLSSVGLSATEITSLSGALNAVSESSERAGSRLRRLGQEMTDPRKISDMAGALGMTSDEFENLRDKAPMDLIRQMATEFKNNTDAADNLRGVLSTTSRQAVSGLSQNLDGLDDALGMTAGQFENATSLEEEFEASTQTLSAQTQLLWNTVTRLGISIGSKLIPPLTSVVKAVRSAISSFSEFNETADGMPAIIALVSSAVGGLVTAFLAFGPTIASLIPSLSSLAVGFATVTGPIAAVAAAIVALQSDFGGITTAIGDVVTAVETELVATFTTAEQTLGPIFDGISNQFDSMLSKAENATSGVASAVSDKMVSRVEEAGSEVRSQLDSMGTWWDDHGTEVTDTLTEGYANVRDQADNALSTLETDVVSPAIGTLDTLWSDHGDEITGAISGGLSTAQSKANDALSTLESDVVSPALGQLEELWGEHGTEIRTAVGGALDWVDNNSEEILWGVATKLTGPLGTIVGAFRDKWDEIKVTTRESFDAVSETVSSVMGTVDTEIVDHLLNSESKTRETFGSMKTEIRESMDVINGIVDEVTGLILDNFGEHIEAVAEIWEANLSGEDGIIANTREALNTLWQEVIKPILDVIQAGWDLFGDDIIQILDGVLGTLLTVVEIGMDGILTAVNVILDLISGDFEGAWNSIGDFVERTVESIGDWLTDDAVDILAGAIGAIIDAIKWPFEQLYDWLIGNSLMKDMINDVADFFSGGALSTVADAIGELVGAAKSVFTDFADDIIGAPGSIIDGLVSDVVGAIDNAISTLKSKFNDAIPSSIGIDAGFDIPSVTIGGGEIAGQDIPSATIGGGRFEVDQSLDLPQLASGGLVTGPTISLIGEGREDEFVAPKSAMEKALRSVAESALSGTGGTTIKIDADTIEASSQREANQSMNYLIQAATRASGGMSQ